MGGHGRRRRRRALRGAGQRSAGAPRGAQDPKKLEEDGNRFHFRTSPRALDVLDDAGVDVVSVANNHAGDYGQVGLADTLAAGRRSDVAMVGAGRNETEALAPHRVTVDDLDIAFLAADAVFLEGRSAVWAAGTTTPGSRPPGRPPRPPCSPPSRTQPRETTSWWSTSTGAWRTRPARASANACSHAISPRPGPMSWSAPMRTCWEGPAGPETPTSASDWATSSGVTTASPTPAS